MTIIADVRTALAALLATVSGMGRVHDYFRLMTHEEDVNRLLKSGTVLHAWMVTLADDDAYQEDTAPARCRRIELKFALHGYYGVNDAAESEKAFSGVIQGVIDACRLDQTLGGLVIAAYPPRLREFTHRTFGTKLCHYARVEVTLRAETTAP